MARFTRTGLAVLAFAGVLLASIPARGQVLCQTESDDIAALRAFNRAVVSYVEMHRMLDAGFTSLWLASDPEARALASSRLSDAIRRERRDAARGDIFGPEVGDYFRARLHVVARAAGLEPSFDVPFAIDDESACVPGPEINSRVGWATGVPVTEAIARALPSLPPELEYRMIGGALILVDVPANLVVDVLLDAMP